MKTIWIGCLYMSLDAIFATIVSRVAKGRVGSGQGRKKKVDPRVDEKGSTLQGRKNGSIFRGRGIFFIKIAKLCLKSLLIFQKWQKNYA